MRQILTGTGQPFFHYEKIPGRTIITCGPVTHHQVCSFSRKHGWRLIQKSRGLSEVMRYRKPVSAIDYHAVEISHMVAGANKRSEKGGYGTMGVKEGEK